MELPSPLGHHTWPHIPTTSATASPTPTTPQRGPQEVTGPQNKLPEEDQVPHSPPSHHPAHYHSPPATFLAAVLPGSDLTDCGCSRAAAPSPRAGSFSPCRALRAAPNCGDTLPSPAATAQVCRHAHIHAYKHTPLPLEAGLPPASCPPVGCCCHPAPRGPSPAPHWTAPPHVPPYQWVLYLPWCWHLMLLGWLDGASRRSRGASMEDW